MGAAARSSPRWPTRLAWLVAFWAGGVAVAFLAAGTGPITSDIAHSALEHFQRAIHADPLHVVAHLNLVEVLVGLDHRDEALAYAERFGRGIDRATADRFVAMYVNELTIEYGETGRRAVEELFRRADAFV